MTIDKAIRILKRIKARVAKPYNQQSQTAFQLGIEALKAVKKIRNVGYWSANGALPGETKE